MQAKATLSATQVASVARMGMRLMPEAIRLVSLRWIAARPTRPLATEVERQAYGRGHPLTLGARGRLPARTWGEGPTVALVHGWGGRAAQLAPLAEALADRGYRTVVFDVAGHGESPDGIARWEWFIRDITMAAASLGPLQAMVGHSAGGLSMMGARRLGQVQAQRFVCVCAPFYPYPPVRGARERLNPGQRVLDRYQDGLAREFRTSWADLVQGAAWVGAGPELLVCHDDRDRFVDPADGDRVKAVCPGARLHRTSGYGHVRILGSSDLAEAVEQFVGSRR